MDAAPAKGLNHYRIRSTGDDGRQTFSSILRLNTASNAAGLAVYPNPVKSGDVTLQLSHLPAGRYSLQLIDAKGRTVNSKAIAFAGGSSLEGLPVSGLSTLR